MTNHPTNGSTSTFPSTYHLTQGGGDLTAYAGLYGLQTPSSSICSQATIQNLTAKLNYTSSIDTDPTTDGDTDIMMAVWDGTNRLEGNSNVVSQLNNDANISSSTYTPLNTPHQLEYALSNTYSLQDISNLKLAVVLQQSNTGGLDSVTINSLKLDVTYDDSTCSTFCPAPGITSQVLTPNGDCDGDGITNQTEGYDPDGDGNPGTGTPSVDTDHDGIPDYLDIDTDNDGVPDSTEKGNASDASTNPADTNKDGLPDYRDPNFPKALGAPKTGRIIGATIGAVALFGAIIFFAYNYFNKHDKKSHPTRI